MHQLINNIRVVGGVIQGIQQEIKTLTDEFTATSVELQTFVKQSCQNIA